MWSVTTTDTGVSGPIIHGLALRTPARVVEQLAATLTRYRRRIRSPWRAPDVEPRGQALSYPAVYDLVKRLRKRTGIDFDPHWCRHSAATRMLRDGVPIEVVSTLLGHSSVT